MKVEYEYKFKSGEYRPCIVSGSCPNEDEKALFHRWIEDFGNTSALVEFEDGRVLAILPQYIHFLDSPGMFSETCWNIGDKERDNL